MTERQARTGRGGTILETLAALVFALALAALGCNGDGGGADAAGGDGAGGDDVAPLELCTTAAECDDANDCTEDACGANGVCEHTAILGPQALYTACTKDCDCDTGLCYDEGYLSPFKWCTKPCGGVAEGCGADASNVCLIFSGSWVDAMPVPFVERAICAPVCTTDQDCTDLDPAWDACTTGPTTLTDTEGEEHTLSLRRTCTKAGD